MSASSLLTLTMTPAAPAELSLTPAATEVGIRLWGMGVLPVDGTFRQFSGTIAYTQADFAQCDVNLTVQVESLAMADQARRDEMLSPNFLDAARFPTLIYRGACRSSTSIDGTLAMRGTTHPLPLKLSHTDHQLTAEGNLDRTVWGMTAKPFIVARTVRIRIIARLP